MSIVDDRRLAGGPRVPAARPTELRGWIARIESLQELQHVSGAHWDREIGAISEINYQLAAFGPQGLLDRIARKNIHTFIEGIKSGIEVLVIADADGGRTA